MADYIPSQAEKQRTLMVNANGEMIHVKIVGYQGNSAIVRAVSGYPFRNQAQMPTDIATYPVGRVIAVMEGA